MKPKNVEKLASSINNALPFGKRLGVIGSASFWGADSEEISENVGRSLANIPGLILLTGGMTGVAETVSRRFFEARQLSELNPLVYHILPQGCSPWDFGETLFAGSDYSERREVLGRLADVYLAIEGGPGTIHEAKVAQGRNVLIVPVGRSGGFARDLFPAIVCPAPVQPSDWAQLNDSSIPCSMLAESVRRIILAILGVEPNQR